VLCILLDASGIVVDVAFIYDVWFSFEKMIKKFEILSECVSQNDIQTHLIIVEFGAFSVFFYRFYIRSDFIYTHLKLINVIYHTNKKKYKY